MGLDLRELAARLGCELKGDGSVRVNTIAPLNSAAPDAVSFLSHKRFKQYLTTTEAGGVILKPADAALCPVAALISDNPYATYARAAAILHPQPEAADGISSAASVAVDARLGSGVSIGARAVIESGVTLGSNSHIAPGCVVGAGSAIGKDCRFMGNVTVYPGVTIGDRVIVHAGAVIGSDGFGFAQDNNKWLKVPQLGSVIIGDDVEIGANTTIDCGALGDTIIEQGVKLDNQIQVAHNVRLGEHTAIAGCAGIAGSAVIGRRCTIGGGVVILGHLELADDVHITAMSLVTGSIDRAGTYSSGSPLEENSSWRRNFVRHKQLDDMARRIRVLEQELDRQMADKKQD